jgi:hypothetical protein
MPGLVWTMIFLFVLLCVAGMTGVYHHTPWLVEKGLLNFFGRGPGLGLEPWSSWVARITELSHYAQLAWFLTNLGLVIFGRQWGVWEKKERSLATLKDTKQNSSGRSGKKFKLLGIIFWNPYNHFKGNWHQPYFTDESWAQGGQSFPSRYMTESAGKPRPF